MGSSVIGSLKGGARSDHTWNLPTSRRSSRASVSQTTPTWSAGVIIVILVVMKSWSLVCC